MRRRRISGSSFRRRRAAVALFAAALGCTAVNVRHRWSGEKESEENRRKERRRCERASSRIASFRPSVVRVREREGSPPPLPLLYLISPLPLFSSLFNKTKQTASASRSIAEAPSPSPSSSSSSPSSSSSSPSSSSPFQPQPLVPLSTNPDCLTLTFDELSWDSGNGTYFDDNSSNDWFSTWGLLDYGGLEWTNAQIKGEKSSVRPPSTPVASPPNILVSWAATPVVAVAKSGNLLYPKSVWAASQSFYPFSPALPPSTLRVTAQRRESGFAECASAVLPPVPPGQMQFGPRVLVDLSGCGGADALVFGLGNRTAYSDSPRPQLEADQYFALDSLEFCGGKGVKGAPPGAVVPAGGGAELPPSAVYLPNPPRGTVNRRRRRRSERRRRLNSDVVVGAADDGGPSSSSPSSLTASSPLLLRRSLLETKTTSSNGNGNGNGNANSNSNSNNSKPPPAVDAAVAAALLPVAPPSPSPPPLRHPAPASERCFVSGFGNVTYGRTAAATLAGDYYWAGWDALQVGDGLAWLNLDLVSDASPPPIEQSSSAASYGGGISNYGRPHWKSAVYAFGLEKGNGGLFAPQSIQVAAICDARDAEGQRASDARCSPPGTAPPVFEVAGRSALPGSSNKGLRPCALASLGRAPAGDGLGGSGGSAQPLTLDLTACGTVDLLRFRLVSPVFGDQYSFGLDSLRVCSSSGNGGGGSGGGNGGASNGGGFKPPVLKEALRLPDADPPSWTTAPMGYLNDPTGVAGGIGSISTGKK